MAPGSLRPLHDAEVRYIRQQLDRSEPLRVQRALQDLSRLYRKGFRIRAELLGPVQNSILGLVHSFVNERKVVRWALNTLAQLGRTAPCEDAIRHVLTTHTADPESIAAAIAALFKLNNNAAEVLRRFGFDPQTVVLAALQHVPPNKLDLSCLPLPVETASPELLKLALIVVGLNRSPKRLFHPRLSNAQMVKAMGAHHDPIVVQYSIWAITENSDLNLSSLGVPLKHFENYPANVRSWLMQLVSANAADAARHFELVTVGAGDRSDVVRAGLALGLRDTYVDGLDAVVLEWLAAEQDVEVRQLLFDHLVRQSDRSPSYHRWVTTTYEDEPVGSPLRQRIEFTAQGLRVSTELRQIAARQQPDLFRGVTFVAGDQKFEFGNIQAGAVSVTGNATNSGQQAFNLSQQVMQAIESELARAERELQAAHLDEKTKADALATIRAARREPSPDRLGKAIEVLGRAEAVTTKAAATGTALSTIAAGLARLCGLG